jgi:hypothetical protein
MTKPVFEKVSPLAGEKKEHVEKTPSGNIVFSMDKLTQGDRQNLLGQVTAHTDIPAYEGHVEEGYSLRHMPTRYVCPRCDAPTKQHYANFIYATHIAPRVMFAPAGYFCTQCPAVVVDEEMIRNSMEKQFKYRGVMGIDYQGRKQPDFFKAWNGEKAVYILDENRRPVGLETIRGDRKTSSHEQGEDRADAAVRKKKKKAMAKRSRKQNRKRR